MSKVKTTSIAAGDPLPDSTPSTAAPITLAVPEVKAPSPKLSGVDMAHPGTDKTVAPTPTPEAPLRPGLETPTSPVADPNPFIQLSRWQVGQTHGTLRALEVPGGCLVKSAFAVPGFMGESMCFVPDVSVVGGKLVGAKSCCGNPPPA
jgi:hypothetical protein